MASQGSLICQHCEQDILTERQYCSHCGSPLTQSRSFCGDCLKHPFLFDQLHAVNHYQAPFPQLIKQLKYHNQLINAELLGQLLAHSLTHRYNKHFIEQADFFIPVPLHSKKLRHRGFNQAQLIAESVLKQLQLKRPIIHLKRNKITEAQEGLTRAQRKRNLSNAFIIPQQLIGKLAGKQVVIIDDVVTTGATVNALCKSLLKEQVKRIDVWCICRTELK